MSGVAEVVSCCKLSEICVGTVWPDSELVLLGAGVGGRRRGRRYPVAKVGW